MSTVQAVLFDNSKYTAAECRAWLRAHGYKPIKRAHNTENYRRYRITPPNYRSYITKQVGNGIKLVIGFK